MLGSMIEFANELGGVGWLVVGGIGSMGGLVGGLIVLAAYYHKGR